MLVHWEPRIVEILGEMEQILAQFDQPQGASAIHESARRLRNSDVSGITELLGMNGGMDSPSDVVLQTPRGEEQDSKVCAANDRLSEIQSAAWTLAQKIKGEAVVD